MASILFSVLTFECLCWGGNISAADIERIDRVIRKASKIVGRDLPKFNDILVAKDSIKLKSITKDTTHPLRHEFTDRILKSGRFQIPKIKRERYRSSFIPRTISKFNSDFIR